MSAVHTARDGDLELKGRRRVDVDVQLGADLPRDGSDDVRLSMYGSTWNGPRRPQSPVGEVVVEASPSRLGGACCGSELNGIGCHFVDDGVNETHLVQNRTR